MKTSSIKRMYGKCHSNDFSPSRQIFTLASTDFEMLSCGREVNFIGALESILLSIEKKSLQQ
jgi:hypothetical protein